MNSIVDIVSKVKSHLNDIKCQDLKQKEEALKANRDIHDKLIAPIKQAVIQFNKSGVGKKYKLEYFGDHRGKFYYAINIIPNSERIVITKSNWMGDKYISIIPECNGERNTDPWCEFDHDFPRKKSEDSGWVLYSRMGVSGTVGYEFLDSNEAATMLTKILAVYAGGYDRFCCFTFKNDGNCERCKKKCVSRWLGIPSVREHNLLQNKMRHTLINQESNKR